MPEILQVAVILGAATTDHEQKVPTLSLIILPLSFLSAKPGHGSLPLPAFSFDHSILVKCAAVPAGLVKRLLLEQLRSNYDLADQKGRVGSHG
jgi:hypothetical protein